MRRIDRLAWAVILGTAAGVVSNVIMKYCTRHHQESRP